MVRRPLPSGSSALLVLVVLIGINLRPFLTAIGPLAGEIDAQLALGMDRLAWVTLLPLLLIGVGVLLTPSLLDKTGQRPLLGTALLLLMLGSALRFDLASGTLLIASAALCGLGSALVQGTLPGLIKRAFAGKVPLVMGIFSACMMGGGALGAVLTPKVAVHLDWSRALALWSLPVLLALVWLGWRVRLPAATPHSPVSGEQRLISLPPRLAADRLLWHHQQRLRHRRGLAGPRLPGAGVEPPAGGRAGGLAGPGPDRERPGSAAAGGAQAGQAPLDGARHCDAGGGLWRPLARPRSRPILWCLLCGAGLGGSFSLIMVIALDHLPDPRRAGSLSALMQGFGFILAATGPWVAARLHHLSGDFASAWQWQLGEVALMSLLVLRLDPRHYARVMRQPAAPVSQRDQTAQSNTPA